jgi:hypothetical protein
MKIVPVRAELFYADGQTDMTKLIVAFCNFAKAPKDTQEKLYFNFTQINSFFILCIDFHVVCMQPTQRLSKLPAPNERLRRNDLPRSSGGRRRKIKFNFLV